MELIRDPNRKGTGRISRGSRGRLMTGHFRSATIDLDDNIHLLLVHITKQDCAIHT